MALYQVSSGDRILAADLNQFYSILKGVAASGEGVTLIYNAAGVLVMQPSSDPAVGTQLYQLKNNAGTVKAAMTAGGGALFSSQVLLAQSTTIASAATTDLSTATGNYAQISGAVTITAFGTVQAGTVMILEFQGALTLTHNGTSLILRTGANATTAAGDVYTFVSEGSGNWREVARLNATTAAPGIITAGTEVATTSGTTIDFTGIPSGTKRITVELVGVSTNGTSIPLIQLGKSGGIENTGYLGSGTSFDTVVTTSNFTTGFGLAAANAAVCVWHGTFTLTLERASTFTWTMSGSMGRSDAAQVGISTGSKALAAELDRIRLTTVNGTDAFDAGKINILYE